MRLTTGDYQPTWWLRPRSYSVTLRPSATSSPPLEHHDQFSGQRRSASRSARAHVISSRSLPGHGDDDLSTNVSVFEIADRLRRLAQRIRPVDHRREGAGLDELLEEPQVLFVWVHREASHLLAHERRQHERFDEAFHGSDPTTVRFSETVPDEYER